MRAKVIKRLAIKRLQHICLLNSDKRPAIHSKHNCRQRILFRPIRSR